MIDSGSNDIGVMFAGEMGIKSVLIGDEVIYSRPGGYFYLELNTKENDNG